LYRLSFAIAVVVLSLRASPASAAGNCLQDEYSLVAGQTVNCNAKDVKIAFAANPRDAKGANVPHCVQGSTFSFIADFTVVTTASARENIGLYMATAGQVSALGGTCTDNIISPLHDPGANGVSSCSNTVGATQCLGTSQYKELDASPDNCGDISTANNNQVITVAVNDVKCEPPPGCDPSKQACNLVLPNCTSWQQPGGTILCQSTPPNTGWPYVTAAIPGAPSKCSCNNTFTVPIQVLTAGLGVVKSANPTSISGTDGGSSNYTVTVTNMNNANNDKVEQVCDNQYGNIATDPSYGGPACAKGTLCATGAGTTCATNISCPTPANGSALPATLANPGDSLTCTFTGFVPEDSTVTDTVTATAIPPSGGTVSGTSNAVSVTAGDAPAAATFVKTLGSANPTTGCATVVYNVEVDNTSGALTDESETLTSLSDDKYGDITTTHGNAATNLSVVSTTCQNNQTIDVNGNYKCSFDAVMCGSLGPIASPTACSAGLELTDTLSGVVAGDELGDLATVTPGSRTVEVCFSASSN
jgi:hypothetical protein